ncbi:hypothetical protein FAES_2392 [Fibrella aestuarina BUZ 2]|uniref:Uncharacterized protein n=1 Tax=Fibrella aestuarina BUZ 2 TaxID=1166018 RepID=I0K8E8_9BACT|nr:hypothetical protein [Fibrella aestuarina]CCH00401.1 hypothetical protein FAES_2392 [Fibrella aestuarina BUZ 2]
MTIDILHQLVHSLTKSEKRYVRMEASSDATRGFLRLFYCLLRHDTPGDALTADLALAFPGVTLEPARKYLYRVVMQSLRQFEQDKRIDVRIGQLLHDSQILYERGLVQFSQEQLEKVRTLAEQHERGLYAVLAARQQVEQWVRWQFDGVDEATLAKQHALIRQQTERTQTAMNHAALYETLLMRYRTQGMVGNPADTLRLNDLLLEEYQLLNRQNRTDRTGTSVPTRSNATRSNATRSGATRSFAMQQQHLHFQSAYFRMIGDVAGSLRVYRELDQLFQSNTALWAEQPLYYVQLLEGILADLRVLERYDDMPFFIDRLRLIDTPVQGLNRTVPSLVLYHSLLLLVDQRRFAEAATLLGTYLTDAASFERGLTQLALPTRTEFDLLLVRLDLGLGRLSAALQHLNRVLARPARSLTRTLYTQSRLMNLLLHARLGNADYLSYALRSVARKLTTSGAIPAGEQLVLTLIRQWLKGKLPPGALVQISTFRGNPADYQLLRNLDLALWAKAVVG